MLSAPASIVVFLHSSFIMRVDLQNYVMGVISIWPFLSKAEADPEPFKWLLHFTLVVLIGIHYELLLSSSTKERVCIRAMRMNADSSFNAAQNVMLDWSIGAMGLQFVSAMFCAINIFPHLMCGLFALSSILSAAIGDVKVHMDEFECRMQENAKENQLHAREDAQ
ncbi:Aste57867_8094 [Aphanomyces stellatus]|uniref:Aste57867_8094 protein n=1 Tax=Aphanomyces stellatus TaxID=120398 RepID=A0A485KJD7_9STRA|nr:hypothetical protein As57867_008064 [Aphanomyces stellatus]VFT84983.1 Aste57867_8094 [Aphanomyces stellatus]